MYLETDFGLYLHHLRKEKKKSLKEVAENIGIDISTLSKIEHGERNLQSHMVAPLASALDVEYRTIKLKYINQKILQEFGTEPLLMDALNELTQSSI